jgi:glycosyltransferase involved in cell wall biosynthesis
MKGDQFEPSVCVIIPMFNAAATIGKALESLAQQTRLPDRVIVVDDGSTDNSAQTVERLTFPYELLLIRQKNKGPAAARNAGLFRANEKLLAFLDADDYWFPEKLEKQVSLFQALSKTNHNVGMVDCFGLSLFDDGRKLLFGHIKKGKHFFSFVNSNVMNGTSSVLVLRHAVVECGGFDPHIRFAEDRWLWTQIAEHYEIHTVAEILYHRLVGKNNITAHPEKTYEHKTRFIELYLRRYGSLLSGQQRLQFILSNHAEFLDAFSRAGAHHNVTKVYKEMLKHSWKTLFFLKGNSTLRYIHSRTILLMSPYSSG